MARNDRNRTIGSIGPWALRVAAAMAALMALAAAGCGADRDPESLFAPNAGTLVVDAAMIVDQRFPDVYLTETQAANEPFSVANSTVHGATIEISSSAGTVPYHETGNGIYSPLVTPTIVAPNTTYRIEVQTTDGRVLTAATTTPARFEIDTWVLLDDTGTQVVRRLKTFADVSDPDSIYSQPENQLVYAQGILEARYAHTTQVGYQSALFSLDPDSPLLIDPDFIDDEDLADLERQNTSPPFDGSDGRLRLPWLAVWYEGRYLIRVYSLDRNWFDLARTDPTVGGGGFGFGGNAGDTSSDPIFHVQGGIGLFGSASMDVIGVTFHPRP